MDLQMALEHRAQVQEFQRKHHIGLLTLVFTDLVGFTQLKQTLGDADGLVVMRQHHAVIREVLSAFSEGEEISTAGDAFFIVFSKPSDAVKFSLLLQARLRELTKRIGHFVADRIGIHVGEVFIEHTEGTAKPKDLYGIQVDISARVMSMGKPDQILMTRFAFDNARQVHKGNEIAGVGPLSWLNHGPYMIKGVEEPQEICEVGEIGLAALSVPADSAKWSRHFAVGDEPVLGWRPALGQAVPGTQWILEKKLGEGGFGEVWLGRNATLKQQRVYKFCFRADRVRSLKREVTLFRLLKERVGDHPNIVGVLDVYFDEAPYYIVMEYVEGKDLSSWCEAQGGLPQVALHERLEIVAQIADALQAAHDAGVIHRDVKPSNILIGETPASIPADDRKRLNAKLTDFGIGQVVSADVLAGMTRSGFTQTMLSSKSSGAGTHMYMAPELISGKPATNKSDIYALGVVLYQMLIGDFSRAVTTDWSKDIDDPLLRDDLSRCFAGNPEERFSRAEQLKDSLRAFEARRAELRRQQVAITAREKVAYRRGILRTAAVALCIVGAMAALVWYAIEEANSAKHHASQAILNASRADESAKEELRQRVRAEETLSQVGMQRAEDLFRSDNAIDGLAYLAQTVRRNPTNRAAAERLVSALSQRSFALPITEPLRHDSRVRFAQFSPDGFLVVTISDDKTARVWDARTGTLLTEPLKHGGSVNSAQFSPDGTRLITGSNDQIARIWDVQTGQLVGELQHGSAVVAAQFSSDGLRALTAEGENRIHEWNILTQLALTHVLRQEGWLKAGEFKANGRQIATISSDNTAQVWDTATGQPLTEPLQHNDSIFSAQISPDGRRLVTACKDKTARIWDAQTSILLLTLKHEAAIYSAAFSSDGQRVVTASEDKTARVWDVGNGQPITNPFRHGGKVYSAQFSPNGMWVVTASVDGSARVWDARTGLPLTQPLRQQGEVYFAQFSPDGQRVVATSEDDTVRVWDVRIGQSLATKTPGDKLPKESGFDQPHSQSRAKKGNNFESVTLDDEIIWPPVKGLMICKSTNDYNPLGREGISGVENEGPEFLKTKDFEQLVAQFMGFPMSINALKQLQMDIAVFGLSKRTPNFDVLFPDQAVENGVLQLVIIEGGIGQITGLPRVLVPLGVCRLGSIRFSKDALRVVVASHDQAQFQPFLPKPEGYLWRMRQEPVTPQTARVWDAWLGVPINSTKEHSAGIYSVQFSPDDELVITASEDHTAALWQFRNDDRGGKAFTNSGAVYSAEFSPNGRQVVWASEGGFAQVRSLGSDETSLLKHEKAVYSAQFSPDSQRVVTASLDQSARIWNAQTGEQLTHPLDHKGAVYFAQFSPDGRWVVTASADHSARVWDARTGQPLTQSLKHSGAVYCVQFSPDGQRVVTASADHSARVWDARTGAPLTDSLRHDAPVFSVEFSPDGRRVVTASQDKTARVWDSSSGLSISEPLLHESPVYCAHFSPDGDRVAVATEDNTARIWDVPAARSTIPPWLPLLAEAVAGIRFNEHGGSDLVPFDELLNLRQQILKLEALDFYTSWAKWFFEDRSTRHISYCSPIGIPEYVQRLIEQNTAESLQEAIMISPANDLAKAHMARMLQETHHLQNPSKASKPE